MDRRLAAEPGLMSPHVESCLVCQATRSRYRIMARRLEALRDEWHAAPGDLVLGVLVRLNADPGGVRRFPAEAFAVAGLAAAAGAVAWWRKRGA